MRVLSDFLRGVADGLDRAAGRDVVDQAAVEAIELLDDPAEFVVTGPDLTDNQALQVAIHFQETRRDLRRFQQMYGKASATIGHLRGRNAFLAEELLAARTTIRLARTELDLAAGESLSDAIAKTRDRARALEAKLAEKNADPADPADSAKVGDPIRPATGTRCGAKIDGGGWNGKWHCTRAVGHRGQHVASSVTDVVAVWPNENDPAARPPVSRDDLANELLRAYTGNEESNAGVAIGWGPVAVRAVSVLLGSPGAS